MKQIDIFVDSVYQHVGGNKKEIQELKEEMKSHLIESIEELVLEGKTEKEAIDLAIERFGGEHEMKSIITQLFQAQKTFAKWILYLAIISLIASISIYTIFTNNIEAESNELSIVATNIDNLLENKTTITSEMESQIEGWIKDTNFISSVKIYNMNGYNSESETLDMFDYAKYKLEPDYQLSNDNVWAPKWLNPEFYPYGNGTDEWLVTMEERYFNISMLPILFAGVAIYWTLFSIWAIVNAFHKKRLNIGWILVFVFFNVVGYLLYLLIGKFKSLKLEY